MYLLQAYYSDDCTWSSYSTLATFQHRPIAELVMEQLQEWRQTQTERLDLPQHFHIDYVPNYVIQETEDVMKIATFLFDKHYPKRESVS